MTMHSCVCACVFGAVAGGMPVKMPQESSRVSREATESSLGDVETGRSVRQQRGLCGTGVFESAGWLLHRHSCSSGTMHSKKVFPDLNLDSECECENPYSDPACGFLSLVYVTTV